MRYANYLLVQVPVIKLELRWWRPIQDLPFVLGQGEQSPLSTWRQHQASPHEGYGHTSVFGVELHLEAHNAISDDIKVNGHFSNSPCTEYMAARS